MIRPISILLLLSFTAACGSSFGRRVENRFPTQAKLDEIATQKTETDFLEKKKPGKFVETWELQGPLPSEYGAKPLTSLTPLSSLAKQRLQSSPDISLTQAMDCAAREFAAFHLVHNQLPFQSLKRFIGARCGATSKVYIQTRTFAEGMDEASFLKQHEKNLAADVDWFKKITDRTDVGVAYANNESGAVLVFAYQIPTSRLKSSAMRTQPGGYFVVEGELDGGRVAESFSAIFNKGQFDVGRCESQPVDPPKFKFVCQADPADAFSHVQISYAKPEALFSTRVAEFMVLSAEETSVYRAPSTRQIIRAAPAAADTFSTLEGLVNAVRTSAGRPAMKVDRPQSDEIQRIVPAFFDAQTQNVEDQNTIVMGMIAGWKVSGEIVNAGFSSDYVDAPSPHQLVESVLETPWGRQTLLSPTASVFAFGALQNQSNGMASVFVSYDFMPQEHTNKRIKHVLKDLNAQRKTRGKSPAREVTELRADAHEWAGELEEGASMEAIAKKQQQAYLEETGARSVNTMMYLVPDLEDVKFQPAMLSKSKLEPAIVVAPYRPDNSPWTFYAVIISY